MLTNHTQRATVRPSRMRRAMARVVLIHDRADAWLNDRIVVVFATISALGVVLGVSLATWSLSTRTSVGDRIVAVLVLALMLGMSAAMFAVSIAEHVANDERAKHRRTLARVMRERDDEAQAAHNVEDALRADLATQRRALTDARWMLDHARDERDALAYVATALLNGDAVTMRERVIDACDRLSSGETREYDDATLANAAVLILRADENAYLAKHDA